MTLIGILLLFQVSDFFGFGQLQPVSHDKFSMVPLVPTPMDFYCGTPAYTPLCSMFVDLVKLEDPKVDQILMKLPKFQLTDNTGAVVFPRP